MRLDAGDMLVRRFLAIVTAVTLLVVAAALAYRLFAPDLMRLTFVPSVTFSEDAGGPALDYSRPHSWLARPGLADDPSRWTPPGVAPTSAPRASIFFVHPTSFLEKSRWNAPPGDRTAEDRARIFLRSQASAFNAVGDIWAPRYRQATVGAFLTAKPDADKALDFAYRDVRAAFDAFLEQVPANRPIILAGHSQGSYHLTRLLADRIAGTPLARRIVAVYAVGWPISLTLDVPRFGVPACKKPTEAGCLLAWQSFSEPADPRQLTALYDASVGPNGQSRAGTPLLCANPVTGTIGGTAPASANSGSLIPNAAMTQAHLEPGRVPARCDARGLLLIGEHPPSLPPLVLPGNNYHVFDYALFWSNIRADAGRRLASFGAR